MGRGDKRTKRGKISMGSFGKKRIARRTLRTNNATAPVAAEETATEKPKAPRKKAAPKKEEEGAE
jgi:ribosomal small subunit protein bTHX